MKVNVTGVVPSPVPRRGHAIEVAAVSLYEAAVLALAKFCRYRFADATRPWLADRYLATILVTSMESPVNFPVSVMF
jgi:hypothetical protein